MIIFKLRDATTRPPENFGDRSHNASELVIQASNLHKSFAVRKSVVQAVEGVDLQVKRGEVFGFLGPNGAGKTTTLRMLTTLLPIDSGEATVGGLRCEESAPSGAATHRLRQSGRRSGQPGHRSGRPPAARPAQAAARVGELAAALDLEDFIDRRITTYSGGQRRRLDVALGLVHQPQVLFLDEPTTGLDPQNRANLWQQIRQLRETGTTIFLTTHYLEEADALSDRLAIMDHGKIVAQGTPRELKQQIAGDAIVIRPKPDSTAIATIRQHLAEQPFVREARVEGEVVHSYVDEGASVMPKIFKLLEVALETVSLSQPSLDDVFLKQTGHSLRDAGLNTKEAQK